MDPVEPHHHEPHEHELRSDALIARAAVVMSALGDPERLRLLELLHDGPHCVSELAEETGASMSTVSQRLKLLTHAALVTRERDGKHIYYALADDNIRHLLQEIFDHVQA